MKPCVENSCSHSLVGWVSWLLLLKTTKKAGQNAFKKPTMKLVMRWKILEVRSEVKGGTRKGRWRAGSAFRLEGFYGTLLDWGGGGGGALEPRVFRRWGPKRSSYLSPTGWHPQCQDEAEINLPLGEESKYSDLFDLGVGSDVCVVGKELPLLKISRRKLTLMWIWNINSYYLDCPEKNPSTWELSTSCSGLAMPLDARWKARTGPCWRNLSSALASEFQGIWTQ